MANEVEILEIGNYYGIPLPSWNNFKAPRKNLGRETSRTPTKSSMLSVVPTRKYDRARLDFACWSAHVFPGSQQAE
jgi:hypothetical protein